MNDRLKGKKVAIVATHGFEEVELSDPKKHLEEQGAETHIVAPQSGAIRAWRHDHWSEDYQVDKTIDEASPGDYDAIVLPGGVMNPDQLRKSEKAVNFIEKFFATGKPVAAICHGAQTLIETGALQGRTMTSYPSIKTDLKNAGVRWEDREVVVDQALITSRTPDDLPAFNRKIIEEICEGKHARQKTV